MKNELTPERAEDKLDNIILFYGVRSDDFLSGVITGDGIFEPGWKGRS